MFPVLKHVVNTEKYTNTQIKIAYIQTLTNTHTTTLGVCEVDALPFPVTP